MQRRLFAVFLRIFLLLQLVLLGAGFRYRSAFLHGGSDHYNQRRRLLLHGAVVHAFTKVMIG